MAKRPLCCDPFGHHAEDGVTVPTANMHHIKGVVLFPELAFVMNNCRPLCTRCHARIDQMERQNKDTEHLFANGETNT